MEIKCLRKLKGFRRDRILGMRSARCQGVQSAQLPLPLREILRRDQILDLTGTLQVSLGAPLGGVCSPTHARVPGAVRKSPWATRRVKGIDPRVVDSRTRGRACARPSVTLLHALGYRDTMVALLLVVVSGPVDSFESTCFVLSVELHFGSLEVYCALGRWPNPTRKLVSSHMRARTQPGLVPVPAR